MYMYTTHTHTHTEREGGREGGGGRERETPTLRRPQAAAAAASAAIKTVCLSVTSPILPKTNDRTVTPSTNDYVLPVLLYLPSQRGRHVYVCQVCIRMCGMCGWTHTRMSVVKLACACVVQLVPSLCLLSVCLRVISAIVQAGRQAVEKDSQSLSEIRQTSGVYVCMHVCMCTCTDGWCTCDRPCMCNGVKYMGPVSPPASGQPTNVHCGGHLNVCIPSIHPCIPYALRYPVSGACVRPWHGQPVESVGAKHVIQMHTRRHTRTVLR
mmetsp:Transcript_4219/g.10977  ORF Transcript_4219/g.10977 Transcript_4219/m.10977 type:complete len:267 (-) Transcript_4219:1023-1823(-)